MKKYGMLMTPPLAQKAHDGDKTVTRRIIPLDIVNMFDEGTDPLMCENADGEPQLAADFARYRRGMIVAVKETHWRWGYYEKNENGNRRFVPITVEPEHPVLFADPYGYSRPRKLGYHKRPSLFLPFDLARAHIKILDVRPERLQDITGWDAMAEGVEDCDICGHDDCFYGASGQGYKCSFERVWDSINGKTYPWASNCWVWRYEFERVEI